MTSQVQIEGSDLAVYGTGSALARSPGIIEAYDMTTDAPVVATGIDTYLGVDPYSKGSSEVVELLQGEHGVKDWVEARFIVDTDIESLGDKMIAGIEAKRAALGI